jgi:hypothetical protein
MFMSAGQDAPAEVAGDVAIYVFDDHGTLEEQQRPLHIFEFPGESWAMYLREAGFGSTYQLFIPYTRRTAEVATCNVRLRYTSPEGRITYSKMVEVSLPGTARSDMPADESPTTPHDFLLQAAAMRDLAEDEDSSDLSLASHEVPAECDADCTDATAPATLPNTMSEQIELGPSQIANNQLATLDHILLTLDEAPGQVDSPEADPVSTPAGAPEDTVATETATATLPPRTHRLHPLAE